MQKFTIPGKLDGLNQIIAANRANKYLGAKVKKENEQVVIDCLTLQEIKPVQNPVYLSFLWVEPNRKRDLDNIASAKKIIIDALVKTGVIQNDGWKNITGFSDKFAVDKNNPRIEVTIEEQILG